MHAALNGQDAEGSLRVGLIVLTRYRVPAIVDLVAQPRWTVEIAKEVEDWYATLKSKDKAAADRAFATGSPSTAQRCECRTVGRLAVTSSS
jgi:hypothetical protein